MPIKIPDELPAKEVLGKENIFVMDESRALSQDIRALQIIILNLMPTKIATEIQLLRLLGNTPLQVDITLLNTKSHKSKNTSQEHLIKFYNTFEDVIYKKYDGMIITGAPVENLNFEEVNYWDELKAIMEWSTRNVYSTLHICWGAQAGLYYHYGVPKYPLDSKLFGVFSHNVQENNTKLLRGYDDIFYAPHSRYTEVKKDDITKISDLKICSESEEAGVYLLSNKNGRQIFMTGHSEYDPLTLKNEYERDLNKGLDINIPKNYFPNDNPKNNPVVKWRAHASLLFSNWLNYYVYQETPYLLDEIKKCN